MTDGTLLAAVRHNCWANLELLAFCATLTDERRSWTTPGTYGTIHQTLQHIIGAEHGYLFALTQGPPPGGPLTPDRIVSIEELLPRARSNAERIERVLSGNFDPERPIVRRDRGTATARVIVSQFIHHGSDHRAHIGTILGANGLQPPNLDVWAYGRSIGEVSPPVA